MEKELIASLQKKQWELFKNLTEDHKFDKFNPQLQERAFPYQWRRLLLKTPGTAYCSHIRDIVPIEVFGLMSTVPKELNYECHLNGTPVRSYHLEEDAENKRVFELAKAWRKKKQNKNTNPAVPKYKWDTTTRTWVGGVGEEQENQIGQVYKTWCAKTNTYKIHWHQPKIHWHHPCLEPPPPPPPPEDQEEEEEPMSVFYPLSYYNSNLIPRLWLSRHFIPSSTDDEEEEEEKEEKEKKKQNKKNKQRDEEEEAEEECTTTTTTTDEEEEATDTATDDEAADEAEGYDDDHDEEEEKTKEEKKEEEDEEEEEEEKDDFPRGMSTSAAIAIRRRRRRTIREKKYKQLLATQAKKEARSKLKKTCTHNWQHESTLDLVLKTSVLEHAHLGGWVLRSQLFQSLLCGIMQNRSLSFQDLDKLLKNDVRWAHYDWLHNPLDVIDKRQVLEEREKTTFIFNNLLLFLLTKEIVVNIVMQYLFKSTPQLVTLSLLRLGREKNQPPASPLWHCLD